ncbi:MAG TPA: hypothetical protein VJL28_09365 [Gemmatimonadaceae bacterium]|nr:hypothetical protein [Gemmatimonadaceae bacterium]
MLRLSDAVGAAGLADYAIVALVLFFFAFLLLLIRILTPARAAHDERARWMPLDDGTPTPPPAREDPRGDAP